MPPPIRSPEEILPHIFLPLPSLNDIPKPTTKEDRLKTIIANLDKQHQRVRLGIISAAKERQKSHQLALQTHDEDRMDLDEDDDYPPRGSSLPSSEPAISALIANLNAPYHKSMGDVSVPPPPADGSGQAPFSAPPQAGFRQATPPPEIQLAKETIETIEKYDQHAKQTRKFYVDALERLTRRNSGGGGGTWSTGGGGSGGSGLGGSLGGGGGYRANASPIDFARDPRRHQNVSPNDPSRDPRLQRS